MQKLIKKTLALAFSFAILMTPILSGLETASAALNEDTLETLRQHQTEWEESGISNYEYELTVNGELMDPTQVRNGFTKEGVTLDEAFSKLITDKDIESMEFGVIDVFSKTEYDFLPKKIVQTNGDVVEITNFKIIDDNSQLLPNLQVGRIWADFGWNSVMFFLNIGRGVIIEDPIEIEYKIDNGDFKKKVFQISESDVYRRELNEIGSDYVQLKLFDFSIFEDAGDWKNSEWEYKITIIADPENKISNKHGRNNKKVETISKEQNDYNDYSDTQSENINTPPTAGFEDEVFTNSSEHKNPFPDTDSDKIEGRAAAELYERGVIGGFIDGEFKGNRPVNRAEIAKFLLLARGIEVGNLQNRGNFLDIKNGEWYTKFVMRAAEKGVINGYGDGNFGPEKIVNTAEFLKMLTKTFELPTDLAHSYTDVSSSDWFNQFAGIAKKYNLFPKRSSSKLEPARALTRNEVAVAIYQYLEDNIQDRLSQVIVDMECARKTYDISFNDERMEEELEESASSHGFKDLDEVIESFFLVISEMGSIEEAEGRAREISTKVKEKCNSDLDEVIEILSSEEKFNEWMEEAVEGMFGGLVEGVLSSF